jgi:protein-S-isoprenylcysteine O-methyltransferase Ste14
VLVLLAPIFLVALPAAFVGFGARIDQHLQWAPVPPHPINAILGLPMILTGFALGLWSNYRLFTHGRGTPLPVMPTQELIVEPPYTRTRNPMALGAVAMYLGVAVLCRSPGAALLVGLCAAALLTYIRLGEEPVLVARFGQEYADYRRRTPFLVPRPRCRRRGP